MQTRVRSRYAVLIVLASCDRSLAPPMATSPPAAQSAAARAVAFAPPCDLDRAPIVEADGLVTRLGQQATAADIETLTAAISSGTTVGDEPAAEGKLRDLL